MTASSAIANDDAASGPDAGNTQATADEVPALAEWYDGTLGSNDVRDYYFWDDSISGDMGIIIIAGNHAIEYTQQVPGVNNVGHSVNANEWSNIPFIVNDETASLDFHFTATSDLNSTYCFGLYDESTTQFDWSALNASSPCDLPYVAPAVNVVDVTWTGGSDGELIFGGDVIEIELEIVGYVPGYGVYWWDESIGILEPIDFEIGETMSTITIEALNYDSEGESVKIYVCPEGENREIQDSQGPCDDSYELRVNYKSVNGYDCTSFNHMLGPQFIAGNMYMQGDIVEHPANSGDYWISLSDLLTSTPGPNTKWFGPCNCTEIGIGNLWDPAISTYFEGSVVEYNNGIWIAIQNTSEEPIRADGTISQDWVFCNNLSTSYDDRCSSGYEGALDFARPSAGTLLGSGGPAWDTSMGTVQDTIYEYPGGSGQFWIATHDMPNGNSVPAPGVDANWIEFWEGWCNCTEIWNATGQQHYYQNAGFAQYTILEYPDGSGILWMSLLGPADTDGQSPQEGTDAWRLCENVNDPGSGGPCAQYNGYGGPAWGIGMDVVDGDIYEYPPGQGEFYIATQTMQNLQVAPDSGSGLEFWEGPCNCTEIWLETMTYYSTSGTYGEFEIVSHNNQLYISLVPNNGLAIENVEGWRLCEPSGCDLANGFAGPFYNQNQQSYQMGDVVEYPAGSGDYYVSMHDGNTAVPDSSEHRWKPCSCDDLWDGTTWQSNTYYAAWKIVEHNGKLYVKKSTLYWLIPGDPEPGLNTGKSNYFWRACDPGHCEPVTLWNQNDANNGMYDQGVVVWSYWMGGIRVSAIDDNTNNPNTWGSWQTWSFCKFKPIKKYYPDEVYPPVDDPPGYVINRTHGKLLEDPTDNVVMSTVDMQDGDSSNNFPENCWFENDELIDWSPECTDEQRESPATFTYQMPRVVTGLCDMVGLENSNVVLMDTFEESSQALDDVGGHLQVEGSGIATSHECGAILMLSEDAFPDEEPETADGTEGRYYYTAYPFAKYDDWWDCVWATMWSGERCYGPIGDSMVTGSDVASLPISTYEVWVSDGDVKTKYYAINMVGKTCDMFELNDDTECYDKVVSLGNDGECDDDCPEVISGDADGDGVPNEWDDCPETTEGAATDTNGCEVDLKEIAEDSGLPGFTAITTLVAISMAVAVLRGRRKLEEL